MDILKAKKEDGEKVAYCLFNAGLAKSLEDAQSMFLKELNRGDICLIASEEEKPLGIISWTYQFSWRHGLVEIVHIGVIPDSQGKGVAKQLFEEMIKESKKEYQSQGYSLRKMYLLTHADNKRAQNFYKKMGMEHEATLKDHFRKGLDEYVFAIHL